MITEIVFFVGGILVSGLIGLVFWVSSNRKEIVSIKSEDESLTNLLKQLQNEVKDLELNVHKYVDNIYRDTDDKFNNIYRETDDRFNNFDRGMDSRLDKMENRLHTMYEDGCKPVDKLKTQLNG